MVEEKSIVPAYDDGDILTLDSLTHIRERLGMYIGRRGDGSHPDDGIYVLLKEVIDNSIDEFIMGAGKRIDVIVTADEHVMVRDYGRGIPLDSLVPCVSQINTGGKFRVGADGKPAPFACSIGLNGVGLKAVNALSERFVATSRRSGEYHRAEFERGVLRHERRGKTEEADGTEISFYPDGTIFPGFHFDLKHILPRRMSNYAWMNTGLVLYLNGDKYYSRRGLQDMLEAKVNKEDMLYPPVYYRSGRVEFVFTHVASMEESYYSFVNGQYTNDGGTHLSAFKEGVLKAINEVSPRKYDAPDVRDGIVAVVAIHMADPQFESQTKNKLASVEVRSWMVPEVSKAIADALYKNGELKEQILAKISDNVSVLAKIQTVKKEAKELAKKVVLRIPKLKDCKFHLNEAGSRRKLDERDKCANSVLFLTEGDSAASNMVKSRNPDTQAVFPLRGKPLNCFGMGRDAIYKNEELAFITKALGIENGLEDLRYSKVIIASDADVDGFHIRLLLITFFLTLFQPLVLSDHLYILETPLFRVRNKKETRYCFTEAERDAAQAALGKSCETTRFKGLGEISPDEFGPFIGDQMRLIPVTVDNLKDVANILGFYMGSNTPARRQYILEHLLSDIVI